MENNWADRILYEDEDLIAIDKPASLPTHQTVDPLRPSVHTELQRFLESTRGRPQYLGIHHRLDRDTSGVLMFSKTKTINAALTELFSTRSIEKKYVAVAVSRASNDRNDFTVKNYLAKSKGKGPSKMKSVRSGGDLAETSFRIMQQKKHLLLIEASPKTGRTHQIRVHLAESGLPILGDHLYGGAETGWFVRTHTKSQLKRMLLHAASLTFQHPAAKKRVVITSPLPEEFLLCFKSGRD